MNRPDAATNLEALTGEAHVWVVASDPESRPSDELLMLLSVQEQLRASAFHFEVDRLSYVYAHALLRSALSRYVDREPSAWRFISNRWGRPELAPDPALPPLRFNISHTRGHACCVVTLDIDCGIDIEAVDRKTEPLSLARDVLSKSELRRLLTLPEAQQVGRFYELWTLKEAYVKARGLGLSLPVNRIDFELEPSGSIAVHFEAAQADEPSSWRFGLFRPSRRHVLSVAVRRAANRIVFPGGSLGSLMTDPAPTLAGSTDR